MTPWLWVTVDPTRDVALVRGAEARRVCYLLVPGDQVHARGRLPGYVIPARYVEDIRAYGWLHYELVVVSARKAAA